MTNALRTYIRGCGAMLNDESEGKHVGFEKGSKSTNVHAGSDSRLPERTYAGTTFRHRMQTLLE